MMKSVSLFFFCIMSMLLAKAQTANNLYKAGEDGYSCFRIPSIITTVKGTLLAFAEGRKLGCGDAGDINLVLKRSEDGGKTWGPLEVVWDDSTNTCGNPAPVVDTKTGKIILLSTWNFGEDHEKEIVAGTSKNTRRVFVLTSVDDGHTWSKPKEITKDVKKDDWTWYATGPGRGIQIDKGRFKGRLVIPCNHVTAATRQNYSHIIYSYDGENWKLGGSASDSTNESTVAELSDGKLMLNMRNASKKRERQVSVSKNGGKKWSEIRPDTALIEPGCEGNLLHYVYANKKEALLFCNPASKTSRSQLTIRVSFDDGKSWPLKKILHDGPAAYSCLTILPGGNIGCFYEAGLQKPYEGLVFEEISVDQLK